MHLTQKDDGTIVQKSTVRLLKADPKACYELTSTGNINHVLKAVCLQRGGEVPVCSVQKTPVDCDKEMKEYLARPGLAHKQFCVSGKVLETGVALIRGLTPASN